VGPEGQLFFYFSSQESFAASNKWLRLFCERYGISMQKKTNKKSKSIEERLPKIK